MKNIFKTAMAACAIAAGLTVPVFAAEISNVNVNITPEVLELEPGEMTEPVEPVVTADNYFLLDWKTEGSTQSEMVSYYYVVTLCPTGDNTFNTKNFSANVKGGSQVTIKSIKEQEAVLKIKCYPYFRLENPTNVEEGANGYKWRKVNHAKKYKVVICYTDDEDEQKTANVTTDTNFVNTENYEEYGIDKVSVQAIPGSSNEEWKYLLPSEYVTDSNDVDYDQSNHITSFSYPTASSSKSTNNKQHASTNYNTQPKEKFGWINAPEGTWWKNPDGTWPANGWMKIQDKWYLFDAKGYVIKDQWKQWNGVYYCLGKDGALYVNTTTPDGFRVDENGAWIQ